MKNLVVCSLLIVGTWAMPQGYNVPVPGNSLDVGGDAALGGPVSCGEGLVLDTYTGGCVAPVVTRNIYVYAAPEQPATPPAPVNVPPPKVDYNIVFVRSPEAQAAAEPIIVPPPQQRTLVYVLSKKQGGGQRIIEVPAGPASNPEVYFVNYGPGENPQLPGGVDLQSALGAAAQAPGSLGAGGFGGAQGFVAQGFGAQGFGTQGLGGVGRADGALSGLGGADSALGGATGGAGGNTGFVGAGDLGGAGQAGATGFGGADQGAGGAGQSAGGFGGNTGFSGGVPLSTQF